MAQTPHVFWVKYMLRRITRLEINPSAYATLRLYLNQRIENGDFDINATMVAFRDRSYLDKPMLLVLGVGIILQ